LRCFQNAAPTAEPSRKQHDYARHYAAHAPKDAANTLKAAATLLLTQGTAARLLPAGRKIIGKQLRLIRQGIYYDRDGDVVLYRRPDSQIWQFRYKMSDGTWQRQTTGDRNRVNAALTSGHRYDKARFRHRHGLAPERKRFQDVATVVLSERIRPVKSSWLGDPNLGS
jgi:hypothetical protein